MNYALSQGLSQIMNVRVGTSNASFGAHSVWVVVCVTDRLRVQGLYGIV